MAKTVDVNIGDCVLLNKTIAVALYVGPVDWIHDSSKIYVGLELPEAIPNGHNGFYNNKQYFKCKPNHGIILPISCIVRKIKPRELIHRLFEFKQKIKNAQHQKYNLNKSLQLNKNNNIHSIKRKNVRIEGVIVEQNNNYYMMLDTHSIKVEHEHIHYISSDKDENISNNTTKDIKLCDITNYWLKQYKLDSLQIKNTNDMYIFDKLKKLAKLNNSNYDDIMEISQIILLLKDLYEEWYHVNIKNNDFQEKCNGNISFCQCVHRIIIQLKVYQKFIEYGLERNEIKCALFSILNSFIGYSRHKLLDDWDHVCCLHLYEQQDGEEFIDWTLEKQETFNFFQEKLSSNIIYHRVDDCPSFEREHRKDYDPDFMINKIEIYSIPKKWRNNENNMIEKEMIIQDQFDMIHNKILHSSAKYEALGQYESDEHLGLKKLIKQKKNKWLSMIDNIGNIDIDDNNSLKTIISFDRYQEIDVEQETKKQTVDKEYIENKYGKLPPKIPIEIDFFDEWKYYKYWLDSEYVEQLKSMGNESKEIIKNDANLNKISELISIYKKWHFFMQQCCNYDFHRDYPCNYYCKKQPCFIIKRICVLMQFFNKWVHDTINMKNVEIKIKNNMISPFLFIKSLDLYQIDDFYTDFDHLLNFHLSPKDEIFNDLLFCNWKKERVSIYQYFINKIGKCDITKCGIFDRYNISKYDIDYFEQHKITLFAINNIDDEKNEIKLQQKLDECHVMLWHSDKKYKTMKLENTAEYKYFNDIINEWKQ